jgi:hypothetical protein
MTRLRQEKFILSSKAIFVWLGSFTLAKVENGGNPRR